MTHPFIVGLRGVAGAGKTTLQKLIITQQQNRNRFDTEQVHIYPYSMAKPIRDGLACMGITKTYNPELYRTAAQYLGTDLCRQLDYDWWIKMAKMHFLGITLDIILIDDIRFDNEAKLCDYILYVNPDFPVLDIKDAANHESEQWNTSRSGRIDHTIINVLHNQHTVATSALNFIHEAYLHWRNKTTKEG